MLDPTYADSERPYLEAAQARFDALNGTLVPRVSVLLNRIVASAELHPKLMNTLSMLEHMGSHKIMATQHGEQIDEPTLRHLTEECHHAFFMKRQAEKAAARALAYAASDLLAPAAARMYFQRLEAALAGHLEPAADTRATYLYMSMIVELRAIWFYGLYQQVLLRHRHPLSLKRLLGEEQNHLTEMATSLGHADELSDDRVDTFVRTEHALYARLLESLERTVN